MIKFLIQLSSSVWKIIQSVSHNKIFNITFRICITALFFFFINKSISTDDIGHLLHSIKMLPLVIIILISFGSFFFQVLRWEYILNAKAFPCTFSIALKTMLWGNFLAFLTPGGLGELFRGLGIDSNRKIDSFLAVIIDRIFAILIVIFTGVLCIFIQAVFLNKDIKNIEIITVIIVLGIVVGCFLILSTKRLRALRITRQCLEIVRTLGSLLTKKIILTTILSHAFLLIETILILSMFGCEDWINNLFIAGKVYYFMLFLPFFIANVGLREYSFGLFLKQFYIISDIEPVAFGVSNLILFINIILPALAGLLWILISKNGINGSINRKSTESINDIDNRNQEKKDYEISAR